MRRRDFVRGLAAATIVPDLLAQQQQQMGNAAPALPAPVPWMQGINPATPVPSTQMAETVAELTPEFFNAGQMATLTRLCDTLFPAVDGKPGAIAAETPQFLDFFIARSSDKQKKLYSGGLDWLESEARKGFKMPFVELKPEQADTILKPWIRTWMTDHPPTEAHADFISVAHADIRTATVNSKVWSEASRQGDEEKTPVGLYWSPIDPDVYGSNPQAVHMRPQPVRR